MADYYQNLYGTTTIPLVPALDAKLACAPSWDQKAHDRVVIGMAGQLYARDAWAALLQALDSIRWQIAGKQVVVRLMGAHLALPVTTPHMRLEFLGYRSQAETIRLLSEADVLYCPYPFSSDQKESATLCFPSKLATYLAAGRPILVHAPRYASIVSFAQETGAALCCCSTSAHPIVKALEELATNFVLRQQVAENGNCAFMKRLSTSALGISFRRFLGEEDCESAFDWRTSIHVPHVGM